MICTIRRLFVNQECAGILNRVFSNPKSFHNYIRQLQISSNKNSNLFGLHRSSGLQLPYESASSSNQIVYTSIRFKSSKKNKKANRNETDDESDEDSDDDQASLDEFREGDKASDRNLMELKVQTLRLDTILKAGLGLSKSKSEKLFYESKIRIDGKKVNKKSMDILKNCEIDVIKGTNEENHNFIDVGRIEVLSIKAQGAHFVITVRRTRNLTIENYSDSGRYTQSE